MAAPRHGFEEGQSARLIDGTPRKVLTRTCGWWASHARVVAAGHTATGEIFARITRRFLRNRTNSTYRFQSTKQPEMRFRARLTDEEPELELALV